MSFTIANAEKNTLSQKEKENNYTIDDYKTDINSVNDSHSIIARNALGSKRILDVGCGVGYIGRALKEIKDCDVEGIDIDKAALEIAAKYYNQVTEMKIGNQSDPAFAAFVKNKKTYDCIICGDIIEHLPDPGYIVSVLAKKLTPGGKMFISVPNIAHIDVIANLIDERFNYAETGILDNTHLRFWTESSFYDFIRNINDRYNTTLSPKLIGRTAVEPSDIETHQIRKVCGDSIFTFQNIFELKSEKTPKIPRVQKKDNYHKIMVAAGRSLEAEEQLAIHKKIIKDMENSISWKITKPLRKINALFHRH